MGSPKRANGRFPVTPVASAWPQVHFPPVRCEGHAAAVDKE
jgi:hypothetical protein